MTVNKEPLVKLKAMESTERNTSLEEPEAHIIVVDDEPVICQQLERLYTHSGYSVTIAIPLMKRYNDWRAETSILWSLISDSPD